MAKFALLGKGAIGMLECTEGKMAAARRKKNEAVNDWVAKCYSTGVAISRAVDFWEIVEEFILREVHMTYLLRHIQNTLPPGFPATSFVSQDGARIFIFTEQWKAALEQVWSENGISGYQFWFAEPEKKLIDRDQIVRSMQMNIAETAVEKALLLIDHATYVRMSYVSASDRDFTIGPKSASPIGLAKGYRILIPRAYSQIAIRNKLLGMSDDAIAEFLAEEKSMKKFGADSVELPLVVRYLGTSACPEEVSEAFNMSRSEDSNCSGAKFCRKCGTRLPTHAKFCGNCGAATSSVPLE